MTRRNLRHFTALGFLLIFMVGCESKPDPQRIGVFASTNSGLTELTAYGEQSDMTSYDFRKAQEVPTVSKVTQFYVNMPNSTITESKLFWATKLDKEIDVKGLPTLNTRIEAEKNNLYRVTSTELDGKKGGYILLKISMPLGTPDRMYAIHLSE